MLSVSPTKMPFMGLKCLEWRRKLKVWNPKNDLVTYLIFLLPHKCGDSEIMENIFICNQEVVKYIPSVLSERNELFYWRRVVRLLRKHYYYISLPHHCVSLRETNTMICE